MSGPLCVHCADHGAAVCTATECSRADPRADYTAGQCRPCWVRLSRAVGAFEPRDGDVPVGVVIGHYKWASLVELQVAVIRRTCGPVPILVSDDGSPPDRARRLANFCAAAKDVSLWPNNGRIGHVGGDLSAFWKGALWGRARGLRVVAKLSQRFLVTRGRWLQDGASELLASGLPLSTRSSRGREVYHLRTEAVLLDVPEWARPEVLAAVSPRRHLVDPGTGPYAEHVVARVLADSLGGFFWPWALFGEDRYRPYPGTVWHCSHAAREYQRLASQFGVRLDPDFHTDGWQHELAKGTYLYG